MKKRKLKGLLVLLIGAIIFFYPFFSISVDDYIEEKETSNFLKTVFNAESEEKKNVIKEKDVDEIGELFIPALEQNFKVYKNADMNKISKGVALLNKSDIQKKGEGTRCIIAGHRGYYNKRMFKDIDKLKIGDTVYLKYSNSIEKFRVSGSDLIKETEWEKLEPVYGRDMLTLITCGKTYDSSHRLLINCDRIKKRTEKSLKISRRKIDKKIDKKIELNRSVCRKKNNIRIAAVLGMVIILIISIKIIYVLYKPE